MTRDRRLSWINSLLLPLFNVLTAFLATGIVFLLIGVDPIEATKILIYGALGYDEGLGYTLYYATNFVFTGLAVAVAFQQDYLILVARVRLMLVVLVLL